MPRIVVFSDARSTKREKGAALPPHASKAGVPAPNILMDSQRFAVTTRQCSEAESHALALWTASVLPHCRTWVANHRLQPPAELLVTLQRERFALTAHTEDMLTALFIQAPRHTESAEGDDQSADGDADHALADVAARLERDFQTYARLAAQSGSGVAHGEMPTLSRDLRRFRRALTQFQLTTLALSASASLLAPAISLPRRTLYLPRWLITALPTTVFAPTDSLFLARPASLMWLFLDAIVLTPTRAFTTV